VTRTTTEVHAAPHLEGSRIDLTWRNPQAAEFAGGPALAGIRVLRAERTFPLTGHDGEVVYDGPVVATLSDRGVRPLTTYYYTVFTVDAGAPPTFRADDASRASAFATMDFGLPERLYRMLPAVHQREDRPLSGTEVAALPPAAAAALAALPPRFRDRGQLFRFLHVAAPPLDLLRSFAEALPQLHDPSVVRSDYLTPLGRWLDWDLDRTLPVFAQRNEVSFAPFLYRTVGTIPGLRIMVNRYTGWYAQVAELAQSIARSNLPPQRNVFAVVEEAGTWQGTDDAATLLGFGAGNREAAGASGIPAVLTGTAPGPFALRPGMRLTVTADDRIPTTVVFQPADFLDLAAATTAEVAAVLGRTLSEVTATARPDGRLVLGSNTAGPDSAVRVEPSSASLVTLEGAPDGRLCLFGSGGGRLRLFYETAQPELAGAGAVRTKTYRSGSWGESMAVPTGPAPAGGPAGVELPDGRLFVAWIDSPHTSVARLRFTTGIARPLAPARLQTGRAAPFAVRPGSHLVLRGSRGRQGVVFAAADFANPLTASATEVAAVLSSRLTQVVAAPRPDGTVEVATTATGGDQRLEIDLTASDAAGALGFDETSAAAGEWGEQVDWSPPREVESAAAGRAADLFAVVDGPTHVRLFWSAHDGARWTIVTSRWDGAAWSAVEPVAALEGGNREPAAVRVTAAAGDALWLFWAQRQGVGTAEDVWTLRLRVLDLATGTWDAETAVTTPAPGRSADREPAAIRLPSGAIRVYFRSDRNGGPDLWSVDVAPPGGTATTPALLLSSPADDRAPAPVMVQGGPLWLLFRSDRSVSPSGLAMHPVPAVQQRVTAPAGPPRPEPPLPASARAADLGTLRRYAGTTTVVLGDAARIGRRGRWDDLLAYTPQKPLGAARGERLDDHDLYTRGTVALFLSPIVPDSPLSRRTEQRLRPVLERFLPITVRAVLVFAPRVTIEDVYRPGAGIDESYRDQYPLAETYAGPSDATAAALPDWTLLLSTTAGHLSADPSNLTTLRRRTWFPPPS
jgi:phage tail-like protein